MTRIYRHTLAALAVAQFMHMALPAPAAAMQLLEAVDHAELAAEVSTSEVNRIALLGDRVARVVRAPDGFAVQHDAASGDLWLRLVETDLGEGGRDAEASLFIGTEKGFTYRLTLTPSDRDAAQILIRNADALAGASVVDDVSRPPAGDPHIAALVKLVRAVARREPQPGYAIEAAATGAGTPFAPGMRLIETWRGPRLAALVLEAERLPSARTGRPAGLAGTIAARPGIGRVAALWLAAPGSGPRGGYLAVAVVETAAAGGSR